jgi:hypothetical protein
MFLRAESLHGRWKIRTDFSEEGTMVHAALQHVATAGTRPESKFEKSSRLLARANGISKRDKSKHLDALLRLKEAKEIAEVEELRRWRLDGSQGRQTAAIETVDTIKEAKERLRELGRTGLDYDQNRALRRWICVRYVKYTI